MLRPHSHKHDDERRHVDSNEHQEHPHTVCVTPPDRTVKLVLPDHSKVIRPKYVPNHTDHGHAKVRYPDHPEGHPFHSAERHQSDTCSAAEESAPSNLEGLADLKLPSGKRLFEAGAAEMGEAIKDYERKIAEHQEQIRILKWALQMVR